MKSSSRGNDGEVRSQVSRRTDRRGRRRLTGREGLLLLTMLGCLAAAVAASVAFAQEAPEPGHPELVAISRRMVEEANESPTVEMALPEVDTHAAAELPHTGLDPSEARHLLTSVFGAAVETPAGIFDEVPEGKFIGENAEIMSPEALAEFAEEDHAEGSPEEPAGPALIESGLPLRVEDEAGVEEPVDLGLEHAEGELQEENPIVPVGIPVELGEGVELAEGKLGISFPGSAQGREATTIEGDSAFYPNVQEDTDLVVAPMPTGVETLTQIRSPEAPRTETEHLSLPAGASLVSSEGGGAEVTLDGHQLMEVTPATAIDAAGNPVETEMSVEGDDLTITVYPSPGAVYPILVDPNFRLDEYKWTWGGSGWAGWEAVDSAAGYKALTEQWGTTIKAADLTSGFAGGATPNTGAQWVYWVPRYASDQSKYGSRPTSWIEYASLNSWMFLKEGNSSYFPEVVAGIINPTAGTWDSMGTYNGTQPEFSGWSGNSAFPNTGDHGAKMFTFGLITLENEAQAKYRNAVAGQVIVELRDEDTPSFTELKGPSGWWSTGEPTISYAATDTGLGVAGFKAEMPSVPSTARTSAVSCSGTNQSPCPRVAKSTESGMPAIKLDATDAPNGIDSFNVSVNDPLYGFESGGSDPTPHIATGTVQLKVDHTRPELSLSGPLTEQEGLGTTRPEYELNITAADGTDEEPQSGIAKVEVKVDGKKVTMANEAPWNPNCASQNCRFSGTWTLKASEYTAGAHQVEVFATDGAGNVSKSVLEVETGLEPLQTSFTSPHPTYENHEISQVAFAATREGKPVAGATFKCTFGQPYVKFTTTTCSSPFELPAAGQLNEGWYQLSVVAKEPSGAEDPTPAVWNFKTGAYPPAPTTEKLVYPEVGKKTADYYTLEAEWPAPVTASENVTGVSFQVKLPKWETFKTVPAECTIDGQGKHVSWPLPARTHPGHNPPVYLKVLGCPTFEAEGYPESEIQFRAVFDGGESAAGASEPTATEFVYRNSANRVPTDATESVGPATVDLLTGAFTISRTDVSIPVPGYEANLEFTRTYSSTFSKTTAGYSNVLGGLWQPASPLESEAEGEAWTRVEEEVIPAEPAVYGKECWNAKGQEVACGTGCPAESCEEWLEEEARPEERWIELVDSEGAGVSFEIVGSSLVAPEYAKELSLAREGENFVLSYPNGTRTTFVKDGPRDWLPRFISYQASASSMRMVYETDPSSKTMRLSREIAPAPAGVVCNDTTSNETRGCRTLIMHYGTTAAPVCAQGEGPFGGSGPPCPRLLKSISYAPASNSPAGPFGTNEEGVANTNVTVAEYNYGTFANAAGEVEFRLSSEVDPRLAVPAETYEYLGEQSGLLTKVTPPGQEPWSFAYLHEHEGVGVAPPKLESVSRGAAKTTFGYEVPISGSGAPYDMGPESIERWGQTDIPVDATAIFPPNHVPSSYPPHEYPGATIHYMDPAGYEVNSASPSAPGVEGATIATTETNVHGNVIRELSPKNRLLSLSASNPPVRSRELDSHSVYNAKGTEVLETWGPLHLVRLASGESEEARLHSVTHYDEGEPTPAAGTPPAYVPTKETVAAVIPGREGEFEPKVTETHYNWTLRFPEETIVDPGGLAIRTVTKYNEAGQVVETRQPKGAAGGTAGDTRTVYYSATGGQECQGAPAYANLPCKVLPAAQASGAGRPQLLVKKALAYNYLDEPTEVVEYPENAPTEFRKTVTTYDAAGRQVSTKVTGGGIALARMASRTETEYSGETGLPTKQFFVCEEKSCTGFDNQATTTKYNNLGETTEYEDADGAVTKTTYDAYGRPATVTDPKGTQTFHYDEASGVLSSMEVSGVGTFTAAYDADGDLISRGLPNGLTATTTYNQADESTKLTYTKTSSCGASCTWYEETLERSPLGQILGRHSTLESNLYSYDKDGRLTEARETPTEGQCTTREYAYDKDSNRLKKTTTPGVGSACATSGGTVQSYTYDEADRLIGPTYDAWGRVTKLPAEVIEGKELTKELTTSYFANEMVASQEQNGVKNTFQLDATGRQRQREQTGGVAGVEIFHYDGPGDSPSWTALGTTWSRNVSGIGGELAAVQESSGKVTFELTDLHGDVIATASASSTATALLGTSRFDEFGEPESGGGNRFGWLGGKQRRTELSSGVIQMGARSYIPQMGRFISLDPVKGGSANAYDYANADPVNGIDLPGTTGKKACQVIDGGPCECALIAQLRPGRRRGTLFLKTVRKCKKLGGITQGGYEAQWSERSNSKAHYHNIPFVPAAYPAATAVCRGLGEKCQNDQKSEGLLVCEPGHEYQLSIYWEYMNNLWSGGESETLHVKVHAKCPG